MSTAASSLRSDGAATDRFPAGFWQRSLAWGIDWLILSPLLWLLLVPAFAQAWRAGRVWMASLQDWMLQRLLQDPSLTSPLALAQHLLADAGQRQNAEHLLALIGLALTRALLMLSALAALYFIAFEASTWQATPGKRLLGLRVQTLSGARPKPVVVALRFFAGSLSWLTLNLGHALVAFRKDGRALHDLIAGTRVQAQAPMPCWARSLLRVLGLALMLGVLALIARVLWVLAQIAAM